MNKGRNRWWHNHRDALASGLLGFVVTSAFLIWPMVQATH
tara:strand:+ start:219 stop:338 length:120 start_codon:yes stop_codon:yes gene_type:complete